MNSFDYVLDMFWWFFGYFIDSEGNNEVDQCVDGIEGFWCDVEEGVGVVDYVDEVGVFDEEDIFVSEYVEQGNEEICQYVGNGVFFVYFF